MSSSPSNPSAAAEISENSESSHCPTQQEISLRKKAESFPQVVRQNGRIQYANTMCMVEVFQVRVDKFDEIERRGEVYGKIGVVDMNGGPLTLYDRDRKNPEHVRANCSITLTGPPWTIGVFIGFSITIELRLCNDWAGCDSEDVALATWQLSWDAMNPQVAHIAKGPFLWDFSHHPNVLLSHTSCKHQLAGYDQPLTATFEGPNSCVTMYYAINQHAVQASIIIIIVDTNSVQTIVDYDVRGAIYASYGHFESGNDSYAKDDYKATLLKTGTKSMAAQRSKRLQLSRCIIAVPAYSCLVIEADLWDTSGYKIAQGKLEFEPYSSSAEVDYILGDFDANVGIQVVIDWSYGSEIRR